MNARYFAAALAAVCLPVLAQPSLTLPAYESEKIYRDSGINQFVRELLKSGEEMYGKSTYDYSFAANARKMREISLYKDLNQDGRPEVIAAVKEGYLINMLGATGKRSYLLSKQPDGRWLVMFESPGGLRVLKSRGYGGFPDLEAEVTGYCIPIFRWTGREYSIHREVDAKGKPCHMFKDSNLEKMLW